MKRRLWKLQFFVRVTGRRSWVMTASPEEKVESVLHRIALMTGIPSKFQRVIHNGKQLQLERTLEQSGVEDDSTLHIVGYLRSRLYPDASKVVDYIVSMLLHVSGCDSTSSPPKHSCEVLNSVKFLITQNFNLPGFAMVFEVSKAPSILSSLYAQPSRGGLCNGEVAGACISNFLSCSRAKVLQSGATGAVMKFCKQLRKAGCGCDDPLYVSSRSTLGFLMEKVGLLYGFGSMKRKISLHDVFSFVPELTDRLLMGLDDIARCASTKQRPPLEAVSDFFMFVAPVRTSILLQQHGLGCLMSVEKEGLVLAEEVDFLRVAFIRVLTKMDDCFGKMEFSLAGKEPGKRGFVLPAWSDYLHVLKELYVTSKLFDDAEEMFWTTLRRHRNMLNKLVVAFAKRGAEPWWIYECRSLTNFECRRHLALMLFPEVEENYDLFHAGVIDRSQLLAQSCEFIGSASPEALRSNLVVEFLNEQATGPGVMREWFVLVCRAIFDPQIALFVTSPYDYRRFYPNSASKAHPRHLEYFRFSGRVIALALMKKVQVGVLFDRVFFMQLAGDDITLEDIRDTDPDLYRGCKQILEMDADFIDSDALGLTFVREVEELGCRKVVELCPGGKSIVMNSKNRQKYVNLLIRNCFVTSISEQVAHFAKGFADILPNSKLQEFFQCLDLEDLDWMLHGSENAISIEDWKAHTKYKGYKETDCQISWFWEIVGRMSAQQRTVLLFFWTSVKYLPNEGFRGLSSSLYICKTGKANIHLPTSHTCFYELCFPKYSSMAVMQDRFEVITQEHFAGSFGTN